MDFFLAVQLHFTIGQFKIAAVKLVLEDNMSVAGVAKELSIHYNSLYRWIWTYVNSLDIKKWSYGSATLNWTTFIRSCKTLEKRLESVA